MQLIVTDGVAWSVGLSVGHDCEPCKSGQTNCDAVRDVESGGPKEPCIRWGSRSLHAKGQFWGDDARIFQHAVEHHS